MAFLDDVGFFLEHAGIGLTLATNLFTGHMPEAPDSCVAIYEYAGEPNEWTHDIPGVAYEHPRLQVVCRDTSYTAARSLAQSAYTALAPLRNAVIQPGGARYLSIMPVQTPFLRDRDANDRFEIVFNCQVVKEA